MNAFGSNRKRPSQRKQKARPFGKLTIDTKCASGGKSCPYESKVPQLSFVSFEESKARKDAYIPRGKAKQILQNGVPRPATHRSADSSTETACSVAVATERAPSQVDQVTDHLPIPSLHKRVKGLRPSPLDLQQDVSPSDQAITIGIALSPSTISQYTSSPPSFVRSPRAGPLATNHTEQSKSADGSKTPVIVITPAKDRFSPSQLAQRTRHRPASSVYSRYTNGIRRSRIPPVPPLPLLANIGSEGSPPATRSRDSEITTFEEDAVRHSQSPHESISTYKTRRALRSSTGIPTPRRSKGWWNILTSPFSAKSASATFWKSPCLSEENQERTPLLGHAGLMEATEDYVFADRSPDDNELRSAPAAETAGRSQSWQPPLPVRSDTAPGSLDAGSSVLNIYRILSNGLAAAYFDTNRHFPSIHVLPENATAVRADVDDWSPSHSVYIPDRSELVRDDESKKVVASKADGDCERASTEDGSNDREKTASIGIQAQSPDQQDQRPSVGGMIFTTPSESELKSANLPPSPPVRPPTQTTTESFLSPFSTTPVIQNAHFVHIVGSQQSLTEQREPRPASVVSPSNFGLGYAALGAATISHRQEHRSLAAPPEVPEWSRVRPTLVRQHSHGLGISDEEGDLYPPPQHISEKPRLGTDRFGQLTVRGPERGMPKQRWYKRFFWLIATSISLLLVLLIVLLAIFVPQRHEDAPAQVAWINLTGFPALPVGLSTIVQPEIASSGESCVSPPGLWTCAAPDQKAASSPNFRLEIRFRNGTVPRNETIPTTSSSSRIRRAIFSGGILPRTIWDDYLYSSSPSPPSQQDQEFLGRTTDNVSQPYDGEETPFYMSLLDTEVLPSGSNALRRRDSSYQYPYPSDTRGQEEQTSNASTSATKAIPSPALEPNGEPAAPQLYPLVQSQPLKLFDRSKPSEHYGFYTYFDRSIYITGLSASNTSHDNITSNVKLQDASAVCTFSQTRMLVQIWTRHGTIDGSEANGESSANDMSPPGSFPYRVTITLDRHGGEADKKGVYCYGLDHKHHVETSVKTWISEDRAAGGGSLVNPASVPGGGESTTGLGKRSNDKNDGGIDGGTGGCACKWQNWT